MKNCTEESIFFDHDDIHILTINKFGTNNDASWMKQDEAEDEEEDKDEEEDEDEDEDSLLTFYEPLRMITKLIFAEFTV